MLHNGTVPTGLAPKIGFGLCVAGLAVALLSLVPAIVRPGELPWPVFVGSMIYLPGAFLAFFSTRGKDRKIMFNQIRMVRLGFFFVLAILFISIARN
ncbi:MAG: hypothetical protein KF836_09975 [Fimbriimonadaceae bacterium]|nr:hypothetical protein [Fimbriimonadaceae bacterium]